MIDEFVKKRPDRFFAYTSLGQRNYLSAWSHVDVVVGNSSSGIVEVPSLGKPTVNIETVRRGGSARQA
jgi:UDP-N-acetylglucosamine 2-epimerase